jgi:uncharacterized protein
VTRAPVRALALAALVLAGCAAAEPSVELKGRRFVVEIADDDAEQVRGLMFRRELAEDRGMLFVYGAAQPLSYWMRNCYIPLDILYFDAQGRFINGHYGAPPCRTQQCPTYPSSRPARYVLELASGVGRELDLAEGDAIRLP